MRISFGSWFSEESFHGWLVPKQKHGGMTWYLHSCLAHGSWKAEQKKSTRYKRARSIIPYPKLHTNISKIYALLIPFVASILIKLTLYPTITYIHRIHMNTYITYVFFIKTIIRYSVENVFTPSLQGKTQKC